MCAEVWQYVGTLCPTSFVFCNMQDEGATAIRSEALILVSAKEGTSDSRSETVE